MLNVEKMKSVIANVNDIRRQTHDTNFEDVKAYCVSKYEETIGIFMEIGKFLEDHIGLFLSRRIGFSQDAVESKYMKRGGPSCCGVGLERNNVNLYFTNRKDGYYRVVYVWLNDGICFIYNIETESDIHNQQWKGKVGQEGTVGLLFVSKIEPVFGMGRGDIS